MNHIDKDPSAASEGAPTSVSPGDSPPRTPAASIKAPPIPADDDQFDENALARWETDGGSTG
jgi:hypothetical protein